MSYPTCWNRQDRYYVLHPRVKTNHRKLQKVQCFGSALVSMRIQALPSQKVGFDMKSILKVPEGNMSKNIPTYGRYGTKAVL
jgi:hypothetical protein